MPVLNRVMGLDLVRTNMHKVFIVAVYTLAALLVFASQVEILWLVGAALALGNAIGGYLGAHLAILKGNRWIKRAFETVTLLVGLKLIVG